MKLGFFSANNTVIIRSFRGERRLHYAPFHQLLLLLLIVSFAGFTLFLTANFVFGVLRPSGDSTITSELREDYEARITALADERDQLSFSLTESQATNSKLVATLSAQQDLLFELERNNYELENNLGSMRASLISSQNRLDALNLQVAAQTEQIDAINSGRGGASDSTLSTITATLSETAMARDEARGEVQRLRQHIALNEKRASEDQKQRDILFSQIEEAINLSLVPMKSTLGRTGLNVDRLIRNVRGQYSGIGGVTHDVNLARISGSREGARRVEKILDNLDDLSRLSYAVQSLPLGKPVLARYRLSSGFGYRRHPISGKTKMHNGVDMAGPTGTPIYATGIGTVIHAGWSSGYGKTIKIRHSNGIETLYAHLNRIRVKKGERVKLGQRIGDMGSTGRSTGPHLHYEVRVNGSPKNPMNYIKASNYVRKK